VSKKTKYTDKILFFYAYQQGNQARERDRLEQETQKASNSQKFLVAFILALISLLVLEKTGEKVNNIAEQNAAKLGWRVSPFLSPGSVHGWELEAQLKLCPLLPLDQICARILNNTVLTPFKSNSCLIGIGPEYAVKPGKRNARLYINNFRYQHVKNI